MKSVDVTTHLNIIPKIKIPSKLQATRKGFIADKLCKAVQAGTSIQWPYIIGNLLPKHSIVPTNYTTIYILIKSIKNLEKGLCINRNFWYTPIF